MVKCFISVSYAITVHNETCEIKRLLDTLIPLVDKNDEIIVLQDATEESAEVTDILASYGNKIKKVRANLNGDFATFKNILITASSKKYLFQIDADEYPQKKLIRNLKWFLLKNYQSDCFAVPRINIVDGITDEYLKKWNWKKDERNYINFPDFQQRLFKLNKRIAWKNKVHEELFGYKKIKPLPTENFDYCLVHPKVLKKQIYQNTFYDTMS